MKKRIFTLLALILCVVMCIGLVACGGSESSPPELPPSEGGDEAPPSEGETPPSENEGTTEGYSGLEFSYSEDSTYILVDMSNCTGTDVVVPSTYNGVPVTRIYGSAFESYPELKSIYIPESIEDVDAFDLKACTKLECITVDEKNQTYMSINGSLYKKNPMTLEYYVHRNGETEFTVPDEVEKIGSSAFDGASALTKIILSKSVTEIYKYSFDGCSNLQYNEYDNGLYLGTKDNPYFALVGAKSEDITACEINTNAKIIGGYSFSNCSNLQSIAVPNSVTRICVGAFSQCIALSNVVLSTSIKAVEDYTFDGCINLSMFYIPEGVTYLGDAFGEIENLMAISIPNSISEIGNNAFFWLNRLMYNRYEDATYLGNTENPYAVLIRGGNSGIIHEDTRVIYTEAFEGRNVTSVIIPDSVISIQDGAFWKCESLESITIGKGVKYIGYDAFNCCSSLKKITIPDNVERVDGSAFSGCSSLEEITIGKGIDKISSAMLSGCSSLKNIEIPDNIKSISANAFGGCSSLTEIRIPSSVTSISDAFRESGVQNILVDEGNADYKSIDGNLYTIDGKTLVSYARGKTDTEFTVPSHVTKIGEKAFMRCTYLKRIILTSEVKSIGKSAFEDCVSIESIELGNGITHISQEAFSGCESIKHIEIPSTVQVIGVEAFDDTNIEFNEYKNAKYIGNEENPYLVLVSMHNNKITSCVVNENTKFILAEAFNNCQELTKVLIPSGVSCVGYYMFRSCPKLTIYCEAESKPRDWDIAWNKKNYPVEWGYKADESFYNGDEDGTGIKLDFVGSEITKEQWEQMLKTDNYTADSKLLGTDTASQYVVNSDAIFINIPNHEAYICVRDGVTYNVIKTDKTWCGAPAEPYDFTIKETILTIVMDVDTFDSMKFNSTKGCYKYEFEDALVQEGMDLRKSGLYEFYFVDGVIKAIALVDETNDKPQVVYFSNVGTTADIEIPDFVLITE